MKKNLHPQYNKEAKVVCACGSTFTIGSTITDIRVELCSDCHPFYTGKQRIVDTENLVKKFEAKQKSANIQALKAKKEKLSKRQAKVTSIKAGKKLTLKDMLAQLDKK